MFRDGTLSRTERTAIGRILDRCVQRPAEEAMWRVAYTTARSVPRIMVSCVARFTAAHASFVEVLAATSLAHGRAEALRACAQEMAVDA